MLKRLTRKLAPDPATLQDRWLLRRFGINPQQVQLWSTSRRAVTRAAGLGILICFLPLPVHTLLALVVAVGAYHHVCARLLKSFVLGQNTRSHTWYRFFNEASVLLFAAIVILVVVKPF